MMEIILTHILDHIINIDPAIKFTVEGYQGNDTIPFIDTLVVVGWKLVYYSKKKYCEENSTNLLIKQQYEKST